MAVLQGKEPQRIVWWPRLRHWYDVNRAANTLPKKYKDMDLGEVYKDLDATPRELGEEDLLKTREGIDVPAEKIVKTVKESGATIVGLSALLTTNLEQIPIVINELKKAGLRDKVKVIIGGATVTEAFARQVGADGYAKDAFTGVNLCKKWTHLKS